MEKKLATYTEKDVRLQLIMVGIPDEEQLKIGSIYFKECYFQIRRNRKRLCNIKWEAPARQKFNALIQQELLQTSIQL